MVVFDPVKPSQMQLTNQTLYLIQLYRYIVCMGLYKRATTKTRIVFISVLVLEDYQIMKSLT